MVDGLLETITTTPCSSKDSRKEYAHVISPVSWVVNTYPSMTTLLTDTTTRPIGLKWAVRSISVGHAALEDNSQDAGRMILILRRYFAHRSRLKWLYYKCPMGASPPQLLAHIFWQIGMYRRNERIMCRGQGSLGIYHEHRGGRRSGCQGRAGTYTGFGNLLD